MALYFLSEDANKKAAGTKRFSSLGSRYSRHVWERRRYTLLVLALAEGYRLLGNEYSSAAPTTGPTHLCK